MRGENKYAALLEDTHVARWAKNLARGSPITSEVALRRLGRLCELLDLSPKEIVAKARKDLAGFQDSLEDLVAQLESEHKSPGYILGILKAVKPWLR